MTEVRILPGTPSLLSSAVERTTLDRVVVGSIPTGGIVLGPGRNIWNPNSLVSSVRQSIGLLRALYDAVNVIRGSRVQAPHEVHSLVPGSKIMESKVLVAQWSAHAFSPGKDDWFESIRAPQASLAQW